MINGPLPALALFLAVALTSSTASAQSPPATSPESTDLNLRAYVELLRSDVRTQKVAIITQVMEFTEAEDAAFWPIYREYDREMASLGDERLAMIQEYAKAYKEMTDGVADSLAKKALDLESRRNALKAQCYERVRKALPARTAAKFLQVEHQLQLLIDLQIAASLPLVQ